MTQEEKRLLLKDLCARLAYGVTYYYDAKNVVTPKQILSLTEINNILLGIGDNIKPYLRPLSSMTEEEKKIMRSYGFELIPYDTGHNGFANIENCIDEVSFRFMEEFLNVHHFDYRDLIEKGLAMEAPEGMYKTE